MHASGPVLCGNRRESPVLAPLASAWNGNMLPRLLVYTWMAMPNSVVSRTGMKDAMRKSMSDRRLKTSLAGPGGVGPVKELGVLVVEVFGGRLLPNDWVLLARGDPSIDEIAGSGLAEGLKDETSVPASPGAKV